MPWAACVLLAGLPALRTADAVEWAAAGGGRVAAPPIPSTLPDGFLVTAFSSGEGKVEPFGLALAVTLAEKLESHPSLRAVHSGALPVILAPPWLGRTETAEAIAALADAEHAAGTLLVFTGIARKTGTLDLTVRLWEVRGATATQLGESRDAGQLSEAQTLLAKAALELLARAGRTPPEPERRSMLRPGTTDHYAFTIYGRALHALGDAPPDLALAEKQAARAVFIDPRFAEAHTLLAKIFLARGAAAKARGRLAYALELRPDYPAPLGLLVRAARDAKLHDRTIELATRGLERKPWDLELRHMLGEALWEDGDGAGALRELGRVVAVAPGHLPSRRLLVLAHAAEGDHAGLAGELEQIVRLDPSDDRARLDLGAAYAALGREGDAILAYEEVVARTPKQVQALKLLGDLHAAKGDVEGAIAWYERARVAAPGDPRAYFLLGEVYARSGRTQRAIKIFLAAQRFSRHRAVVEGNLGALYHRAGENGKALWYLERAARRAPANATIRYDYGLALSRNHEPARALAELEEATRLAPEDAEVRYSLGVVLLRLGRVVEAERAFAETVRLAPLHVEAAHNLAFIAELRRRAQDGELAVE